MEKKDGVWIFDENWFLKYFWMTNIRYLLAMLWDMNWTSKTTLEPFTWFVMDNSRRTEFVMYGPNYPKNLCHLVIGALLSVILTPLILCLSVAGGLIVYTMVVLIVLVATFFGFYPNLLTDDKTIFWPYKRWGETRIPVALWEICLTAFVFYLIFNHLSGIFTGVSYAITFIIISITKSSVVFLSILGGLLVGFFFLFLCTTKLGELARDYMRAKKERVCPRVVVREKPHPENPLIS